MSEAHGSSGSQHKRGAGRTYMYVMYRLRHHTSGQLMDFIRIRVQLAYRVSRVYKLVGQVHSADVFHMYTSPAGSAWLAYALIESVGRRCLVNASFIGGESSGIFA
jgi:hypothetical protein